MRRERTPAKQKRPYLQAARAESTAATHDRILDATADLVMKRWLDEITLEQIAEGSGVNVRTVIRRFGSRDGVVQAMEERVRLRHEERAERPLPPAGDVRATVRVLVEDYESNAAFLLRGLAQEARFPFLQVMFDGTRSRHRAWIAKALSPQLEELPARLRARRLTELAAVTWVLSWKFLRHDSGLDRAETEKALLEMVLAIATAGRPQ